MKKVQPAAVHVQHRLTEAPLNAPLFMNSSGGFEWVQICFTAISEWLWKRGEARGPSVPHTARPGALVRAQGADVPLAEDRVAL